MLFANARKYRVVGFDEIAQLLDIPLLACAHFRNKDLLALALVGEDGLGDPHGGVVGFGGSDDGIFLGQEGFEDIFHRSFAIAPHDPDADDAATLKYLPRPFDEIAVAIPLENARQSVRSHQKERQERRQDPHGRVLHESVQRTAVQGGKRRAYGDEQIRDARGEKPVDGKQATKASRVFGRDFKRKFSVRVEIQKQEPEEGNGGDKERRLLPQEGETKRGHRGYEHETEREHRQSIILQIILASKPTEEVPVFVAALLHSAEQFGCGETEQESDDRRCHDSQYDFIHKNNPLQ